MKATRSRKRYPLKHAARPPRRVQERGKTDPGSYGQPDDLASDIEKFASTLSDPALYQKGLQIGRLEDLDLRIEYDNRRAVLSFQLSSKRLRRKIVGVRRKGNATLEIQLEHFNRTETIQIQNSAGTPTLKFFKSSRKSFQQCLESVIRRNFPKIKILSSTVHSDLEHSLSGKYVRTLLMSGHSAWAALAVSPLEDQTTVDGILSSGLIWMEHLREHRHALSRLLLLVPRDRGQVLKSRLKWIQGSGREIFLLEMDLDRESLAYADLGDSGNVDTLLTRVTVLRSRDDYSQKADFKRLVSLAPQQIEAIYRSDVSAVSFRIRGLEFAVLHMKGSEGLTSGVGKHEPVKTPSDWKRVEGLASEIVRQRQGASRDTRRVYYRLQSERWLESLIVQDIQRIDPSLNPHCVYPQVPAFLGSDRGMIDILSITRRGRLAVLELKVSEDIDLPVQGLDYWLRVRWHQLHQEFSRKGYFHGAEISPEPPLLYFVSPQFRYHDTFPRIVRCFDSSVPLVQVGINEDWRNGIRIVMKRKFNL